MRDVTATLRKEEFVLDMVQRLRNVVIKDATATLEERKEFVISMVQKFKHTCTAGGCTKWRVKERLCTMHYKAKHDMVRVGSLDDISY